ncbi:MAG: hypothetical protein ACOZAN_03725 [Patescibacteria group bacterium]
MEQLRRAKAKSISSKPPDFHQQRRKNDKKIDLFFTPNWPPIDTDTNEKTTFSVDKSSVNYCQILTPIDAALWKNPLATLLQIVNIL